MGKIKIFLFGLVVILGVTTFALVFNFKIVKGQTLGDTWGWLWSSTVGWIKVNSITPPPGSVPYGIIVPTTDGPVTGWVWSSNVGWIQMNPPSDPNLTNGYPTAPFNGVMREGNNLRGWARIESIKDAYALNNSGGWQGWIKFDTGGLYAANPVEIITPFSGAPPGYDSTIQGFAWSNEIGWIKFGPPIAPLTGPQVFVALGSPPLPGTPSVTTLAASNVTQTTATLNGIVTDPGNPPATAWFKWGNTNPASSGCNSASLNNQSIVFQNIITLNTSISFPISNLTSGTTYYYCAYVDNAGVTESGGIQSFMYVDPNLLSVTCSGTPNPAFLSAGGIVTWRAFVTGVPTGGYAWSNLGSGYTIVGGSLTSQQVTVKYSTTGAKNATIGVSNSSRSESANCNIQMKQFRLKEIIPFL
jgi:hypothetical protein